MTGDRALVVLPLGDAARTATLCAALKVDADVVPAPGVGVAAVLRPGTDRNAAVSQLSRVLRQADVLLLIRSEGQVQAERWRAGALEDSPAPGLVLSGLPDVVERLLLTDTSPADLQGAVTSVGMPRGRVVAALWRLFRAPGKPS